MPWYYYSGGVPVPVKRVDGEICVVRPRGYIEAKPQDVRKYGAKMRRTAPPTEVATLPRPTPVPPPDPATLPPSKMADVVEETGVTSDKKLLPKTERPTRVRRPASVKAE